MAARHKSKKINDVSVKPRKGDSAAKREFTKSGGSAGGEFGNKNVLREAHEGSNGGYHIAGGSSGSLGRKRGGKTAHGHQGEFKVRGGEIGADKHPFSSAHKGE